MTVLQAVNSALTEEMARDDRVVVLGEDIGRLGGVFRATEGLLDKYGDMRVMNTPLAESGIIGAAVGMALYGMRPVAEIQFLDFIYPGFDQIVSEAAKMRYRSGGEWTCPMVIRTPSGGGIRGGHYHSQSSETYFAHTPGLRVLMPSNARDAKGMLLSAIFCDDPVVFMEPKHLYRLAKSDVPEGFYTEDIDHARVVHPGTDVTVVTWGAMMHTVEEAVKEAAQKEISVEVVDLRTLLPWDADTVLTSVKKTGRLVTVQEAPRTCGFASEIAALLAEHAILDLQGPVLRVTGFDVPYPYWQLEDWYMPSVERVTDAVRRVLAF
jgi:2-oxoisovalerate dehydrogenase E1 component beta subunit